MRAHPKAILKPRKTPVQRRSAFTVQSLLEATIQVLLKDGADRLTTIRVAERAGVSVGTLYQYYPNKQSLLFALVEQHLNSVSDAIKHACRENHHESLDKMAAGMTNALMDIKLDQADKATALYKVVSALDSSALIASNVNGVTSEIVAMLKTLPNARVEKIESAVFVSYAAMAGATRAVLEAGAPPKQVRALREHLPLLVRSHWKAVLF